MKTKRIRRDMLFFSMMLCVCGIILIGVYIHLVITERHEPFSMRMIILIFVTFLFFGVSVMSFIMHRHKKRGQLILDREEEQQKQLIAANQK